MNLICASFPEFRVLCTGWKQEIESGNVLIRNLDLTRGEPDLKSSKRFLRGDCQESISHEIPTLIVVSKRKLRGGYLA